MTDGGEKTVNGDPLVASYNPSQPSLSLRGSTDLLQSEHAQEVSERGFWGNSVEFILSCLGYAVGLGNIWRFPYLCYTNGGGAFLIPYVIMLVFVGLPVFFLELCVGQYSGEGPATIWDTASPLFKGIGIGMVLLSTMGCIYYNMIIAYALYYMFASLTSVLPWDGCGHAFNTINCYSADDARACAIDNGTWINNVCYNQSEATRLKLRDIINSTRHKQTSSPEEFFNRYMLQRSTNIDEPGGLKWDLVLTLLIAWIICFLCIIKGIKSSGKVVYFTATFPYLVLLILFIRGVTLDGAGEGIKFYLIPKWKSLLVPKVWGDAAGQIFFSLSVGGGGLMTFASYNRFHNNVLRDTLIVALGNSLTSLFAGFVIFSILGFMAHELGVEVEDVVKSGTGLAFIAYPEVVTRFPVSPLWAFLFFFMLLTLGLDSQFAGMENVITAIVDTFPALRSKKTWISLIACFLLFLLGLPMCARGGIYWMELVNYYSGGWSTVLMGLLECVVWSWVYGSRRLVEDISAMIGSRPALYWWICWNFVTPLLLTAILLYNFIEFTPLAYGDVVLPNWAQAIGWLMAFFSVMMIPVFAILAIYNSYRKNTFQGPFLQRLYDLMQPTDGWMPAIKKRSVPMATTRPVPIATVSLSNISWEAYDNPGFKGSQVWETGV